MADHMWRLRPDDYPVLKKAASLLRRQKKRHSGAAKAVEFIDALIETQKRLDQCWYDFSKGVRGKYAKRLHS